MPPIFRTEPPIDIFHGWAQAAGLQGAYDTSYFTKSQIQIEKLEALLPLLVPYYLPCRTKEFLDSPLTQAKALTIGRQLARCHSVQICSQEKTILGKKSLYYSLHPAVSKGVPEEGVTVSFR